MLLNIKLAYHSVRKRIAFSFVIVSDWSMASVFVLTPVRRRPISAFMRSYAGCPTHSGCEPMSTILQDGMKFETVCRNLASNFCEHQKPEPDVQWLQVRLLADRGHSINNVMTLPSNFPASLSRLFHLFRRVNCDAIL